jgi:superfamily II DNA or RNA helicase
MNELELFQDNGIDRIGSSLSKNNAVIAVSPTGSGKSVIIANIAYKFINANPDKNVIIFVHRDELLHQIRKELMNWFGIISQKIDSKTTYIEPNCRVFVAMVETFDRRSERQSFLDNFKNIGLVMVDECHLNNFMKIFIHFYMAKRIGFTATPKSAKRNDPLKNYYHDIIIISTIPELLELNKVKPLRGVVPCDEYSLGKINRQSLKVKGQDFDDDKMGEEFGKTHQIENTLNAYLKHSYGKKTLVFNANIDHSIKMHEAFLKAGLNSRHLDSDKKGKYSSDAYRKDCWKWFEETPDAILNNVGIATIGNDIKSIETVIINKATMSMPLYRQMIGRGARPYQYPDGSYKKYFTLLDMGDNIMEGRMGKYAENIDWEFIFNNPKAPSENGVGSIKLCPECGSLNSIAARYCQGKILNPEYNRDKKEDFFNRRLMDCGYIFPIKLIEEDVTVREMIKIGDGIDVEKNIEFFKDKKEYFVYYELFRQIANMAKKELSDIYLDSKQLTNLYEIAYAKTSEWHKKMGKRRFSNFKEDVKNKIILSLKDAGFIVAIEEIAELD